MGIRGRAARPTPGPPAGDGAHRYFFRLYALGAQLTLDDGADPDAACATLDERSTVKGALVGLFER